VKRVAQQVRERYGDGAPNGQTVVAGFARMVLATA
jgi:hypothetical protein